VSGRDEWVRLWASFPVLEYAQTPDGTPIVPAVENMHQLDAWGASEIASASGQHAAAFVLAVWSTAQPWKCGAFNVVRAFTVWDRRQIQAFNDWALAPFRP
jgi:hypothetical protein